MNTHLVHLYYLFIFGGVGTTAMVADRLGRDAVTIDIKPQYGQMSHDRIVEDAGPMFAQVSLEA